MEADQKLWTSEYYELQVVYLKTNYAKERFLHLIEVRELLRQQGVEGFAPVQPKPRASASASANEAAPASFRAQTQNSRSQQSQHTHQAHQSQNRASNDDRNPVFKAALLVGGALAALVVFLVALVK
ncbi:hypothetical protein D3C72_813810 [compost metagenome]